MTVTDFGAGRRDDALGDALQAISHGTAAAAGRAAQLFPPYAAGERREALRRLAVAAASALAVIVGTSLANLVALHATGNINAVAAGRLYRSATLPPARLNSLIVTERIRTIVNLRGGEGSDWYEAERALAAQHRLDFVSFHLSATSVPDERLLDGIVFVLKNAPKPILIHCKSGSDRTGLLAAIYEYAFEGESAGAAAGQLSFDYGHFPWLGSRTIAMDEAFAAYVARHRAGDAAAVDGK
ncbi:tyrosine-protein phosphatase [Jiella sonneratiae]|uniref:Tyrosine-protein phosphatase n=1 Tax=Jiella sonneratiae TaxID=2816856 RepID=A0ABS3IYA0_9HYPH|nr:tyrosine-protein phosphatase [Jiella sonneratiae]MBO0902371.1 tyrosine-protein phosphatase [Jiella sonneratiae]